MKTIVKALVLAWTICISLDDNGYSQIVSKAQSYFFSPDTTIHLGVGGMLDASNTAGRSLSYQFGLYRYYALGFEPMRSLTVTNNGANTVNGVALVCNNRGAWQTLGSTVGEVLNPSDSGKMRALKLWKFVEENHSYFYSPEPFGSQEIQDPVKFMTSYGYGDCFMIADLVKYLNTTATHDSLWIWGLGGGQHASTEVRAGSGYALLDADEGGFYLHLDNRTLASYDDVCYDPYLYLRTQHFGPANSYNSTLNYADIYKSYLSGDNYRSRFWEYGNSGIDAHFSLMPGESFSYVWPDTSVVAPFHQLVQNGYGADPTLADVGSVIKEGIFVFKPDFLTANTSQILYQYNNISIDNAFGDSVPVVHPLTAAGGNMMIRMGGPFVLTGGQLKGSFYARTAADVVKLEYSGDLANWTTLWQSQDTGHFTHVISLTGAINPLAQAGTYGYYLRFDFSPQTGATSCGIDSITVTDSCQVSRFFAPSLHVGDNSIAVQTGDAVKSGRSLQLDVNWAENASNTPPGQVAGPVFPLDGSSVDSTYFTFSWQPSTDADGDAIVDYYFELSDDSSMSYPLATNFDRYMSGLGGVVTAQFRPERPDFLNDGTTYYWRVRALDSRGAWGPWSTVWRFTPHGPRQPLNFHYELVDSTHMVLKWSPNPLGNKAVKYQIYMDSVRGFFPTVAKLVMTTVDTFANVTLSKIKFIRISSVDVNNTQSTPSPYITLWAPVTMQYGRTALSGMLPAVSDNGYTLGYAPGDTTFFRVNGGTVEAKQVGVSYLKALFINDIDSVIAQEEVPVVVTKAPLLIKAADVHKVYGDTLQPLRWQFTGFVNGDDSSVVDQLPSLSTPVTPSSSVGVYPINIGVGSDNAYTLSYQSGVYTVDSAELTISAVSDTVPFLNDLPALTYTVSGWRNGDSSNSFQTLPQIGTDAVQGSPAGQYDITVGGAAIANYRLVYNNGYLVIAPTRPRLSFNVQGESPDSNYPYMLTVDSSGGTPDNIVIMIDDIAQPGANLNMLLADTMSAPIAQSADVKDNGVYTGILENITPGHDYRVRAMISNAAGSDTSGIFNIFTDAGAPFVVYPNPVSTTLRLSVGIASQTGNVIKISRSTGGEVYRDEHMTGTDTSIDVSGFAPGVYFVTLIRQGRTYTRKVVIVH